MRTSDPQRDSEIVRLYASGQYLTEHIARTFRLSRRRVQQIVTKHGVARTQADANRVATPLKRQRDVYAAHGRTTTMSSAKVSKSKDNRLQGVLRQIVIQLMDELHYDFNTCEQCKGFIPDGKFQIHHTKYDGATFLDLQIVCQPCNLNAENRFLD